MRFVPLLSLLLITPAFAQTTDLGSRVLFDGTKTTAAQWKTATGITVTPGDGKLIIQSGATGYGWAAIDQALPVSATTMANFQLSDITGGKASVQAEWLRKDGSFIKATPLLSASGTAVALSSQNILKQAPEGEKPAKLKLKFWLEGRNAKATYTQASITAPRLWRTAGTTLVKLYDSATPRQADTGIDVAKDSLDVTLTQGTDYAAFVLTDRADYKPKATVLLDLAALTGGQLTVQALCFDKDGNYLKSIDLFKDVTQPGAYEVAFDLFADQVPAETKQVSFKVWLAGHGTAAKLAGIYYGLLP